MKLNVHKWFLYPVTLESHAFRAAIIFLTFRQSSTAFSGNWKTMCFFYNCMSQWWRGKEMIINLYTLQEARKRYFILRDLKAKMNYIYDTYRSPDMTRQVMSGQRKNCDPTVEAFHSVERLRDGYETLLSRHISEQLDLMKVIKDPTVMRIINIYYFAGRSWKDTCTRTPQKKVIEYLEKHEDELNR